MPLNLRRYLNVTPMQDWYLCVFFIFLTYKTGNKLHLCNWLWKTECHKIQMSHEICAYTTQMCSLSLEAFLNSLTNSRNRNSPRISHVPQVDQNSDVFAERPDGIINIRFRWRANGGLSKIPGTERVCVFVWDLHTKSWRVSVGMMNCC